MHLIALPSYGLFILALWSAPTSTANLGKDVQTPFNVRPSTTLSQNASQSTPGHVITPELSAFIESTMERANVPGITLGVVHMSHSGAPHTELSAWGRKTEEGNGHDLAPDALFGLASCSKAFLASAVGLLIDDFAQGRNVTPLPPGISRLDWSTKVADLLPDDWALADVWANKKASLRDVLGHVSGVPRHDYSYGPGDSLKDVVRRLQALRPAYELREKWSYNNQMYKLGAYLVAKYANSSYPAFAESRLFARMNMSATTFWPSEAARSGRVTQTWTKFGRRLPYWFTDEVADLMAGPGGVISSAEDMTKWLTVLINDGVDPITNETILPRSVFEETTSAHFVIKGTADTNTPEISLSGYGMGWMRWSYQGHELITHSGAIPGFSTKVAFLPTDKLGIVLLANADEKAAANEVIMYRIIEDVLRLRRVDRIISTDAQ
ncbi:hypothetical protein AcV7_010047 [Taiwanofungus camphoratus]|nr:hypothetical protein AcV7_010047 [Antrodia cinnamomea]